MNDSIAGDSQHRVHCQHPKKILSGQGNQHRADGMITRLRSWWCPDCKASWDDTDEYTTENNMELMSEKDINMEMNYEYFELFLSDLSKEQKNMLYEVLLTAAHNTLRIKLSKIQLYTHLIKHKIEEDETEIITHLENIDNVARSLGIILETLAIKINEANNDE